MLELARPSDREAINALARQVHEMHVGWRPDIYFMPEEMFPEERFSECLQNREMYVAKMEGNVVGYALLRMRQTSRCGRLPGKVMVIDELCVHEACRGHGIGREMMGDIHALARAFGCTDLKIGVYPQNEGAVRFYESCGFAIRSIDMQKKV